MGDGALDDAVSDGAAKGFRLRFLLHGFRRAVFLMPSAAANAAATRALPVVEFVQVHKDNFVAATKGAPLRVADAAVRPLVGLIERITNALAAFFIGLALKLSYATAASFFYFVGLFGAIGSETLEVFDRASLVQAIGLHTAVCVTILVLARALNRSGRQKVRRNNFLGNALSFSPYAAVFLACAVWHANIIAAAISSLAVFAIGTLVAAVSRNVAIVFAVLSFAALGVIKANDLMTSDPTVELQRSTPTGEEKQDVTLVMSAERGILAITGRPGQVRNIDFIPWDQIRQLRRLQLTSERISLTKQFLKFLRRGH